MSYRPVRIVERDGQHSGVEATARGNHSQCPDGSCSCDWSHGIAGGSLPIVSSVWSSVRTSSTLGRGSRAGTGGLARSTAAAMTLQIATSAAIALVIVGSFRTFQMCSAGKSRAQSSVTYSSNAVTASAGGRSSIRSSIAKPLPRNRRIHSPYVSWNSTEGSSSSHRIRRVSK